MKAQWSTLWELLEDRWLGYLGLVPAHSTIITLLLLTLIALPLFTQLYSGYDDHNAGWGLKVLRCSNILSMLFISRPFTSDMSLKWVDREGLGNHSWRCSIFELVASHYIFWGKCQSDTCIVSHFAHNISLSTLQIKTQWSSHSLTWWREHDSWLYHNKAVIILTLLNFRLIPILFFTTCDYVTDNLVPRSPGVVWGWNEV